MSEPVLNLPPHLPEPLLPVVSKVELPVVSKVEVHAPSTVEVPAPPEHAPHIAPPPTNLPTPTPSSPAPAFLSEANLAPLTPSIPPVQKPLPTSVVLPPKKWPASPMVSYRNTFALILLILIIILGVLYVWGERISKEQAEASKVELL